MVITLDLNLINNSIDSNIQEAYNQEDNHSELFYSNLIKIESQNIEDN